VVSSFAAIFFGGALAELFRFPMFMFFFCYSSRVRLMYSISIRFMCIFDHIQKLIHCYILLWAVGSYKEAQHSSTDNDVTLNGSGWSSTYS